MYNHTILQSMLIYKDETKVTIKQWLIYVKQFHSPNNMICVVGLARIRISKSKRDRQYNGQMKKDKNDLQNITQKIN